jgi:hypothetical protein
MLADGRERARRLPGARGEEEHEDRGESGDGGAHDGGPNASMPCPAGVECDDGAARDDQDEHRDGGDR